MITGFLIFSEMLLCEPDTPKTPLTLLIVFVIEVKADEPDEVFRRLGDLALPVFDATFRDSEQLGEGALRESRRRTQRFDLTHWSSP